MYEEHFRLSGAPFKLNPDPKFFFGSRSHNKAMAYLHYGLKQAEGFIVITGPIGSGKTMVISQLLDQLSASNVVAAQLLTSNIEPEELLDHVLSAFRIEPEGEGRTGKLEAFEDYLFDQLNRGRRVLLIMDEAQNLPFETLEELRMLSNLDYDGTPLFQVFLVGQPEFREIMQSEHLEQLRQRVIASYHLENLSVEETREYIHHRLAIAGWREDPTFSDDAIKTIFDETGGRPRRINTVCNRIMLYCSLEDKHEVTGEIAATVIGELHDEELDAKDSPAAQSKAPKARMPKVRPIKAEAAEKEEPPQSDDAVEPVAGPGEEADSAKGDEEVSADSPVISEPLSESEEAPTATSDDEADADLESPTEETATSDEKEAEPENERRSGGSVFDRVRAKRSGAPDSDAPEATLQDVATAIAKASAGDHTEEFVSDSDEPAPSDEAAALGADKASARRKQAGQSIDETRADLKEANASLRRLKKSLSDLQRRRSEARSQVSDSLQRAESLLREVAKRWS